jgi:phenylalanyl-tRNA synthetase beta chain
VAGTAAELLVDGGVIGFAGRVDEDDGEYPLFAAELATEPFGAAPGHADLTVEAPSRFPGIAADLTLTHALEVPWRKIRSAVESRGVEDLVDFGLKVRYQGEGVPEGAVNTTLYFLYNSPERSLTQEEVNTRQASLAAELERRFGWKGKDG